MGSFKSSLRWLMLLLVVTAGCFSNSKPSGSDTEKKAVSANSEGTGIRKGKFPIKLNVKTMEGNWVVVITVKRSDNYRWLLRISKGEDGKYVAEYIDTSRDKEAREKPHVVSTEVDGDSIRILSKNELTQFEFNGSFQEGFIRGTMSTSPSEIFLTRLLPTDETTLEKFEPTGLPPGADAFDALLKSKDTKAEEVIAFAKEFRKSPLVQEVYLTIFSTLQQATLDQDKAKVLVDDYISSARIWGKAWEIRAEITAAASLINARIYSRLGLAHLDAAEKLLGDEVTPFAGFIGGIRDAAQVNIRVDEISASASSKEVKEAASAELSELLKKQTYNHEILLALANYAIENGKTDQAIDYLSMIVALPLLELNILRLRVGQPPDTATPTELLTKLWVQKNGSEEGLSAFIQDVYRRKIDELYADIYKQVPGTTPENISNRTVLVELLTGMSCPPCVGADLGLSALAKVFPTSNVIVLRLHQHIPLPDGLANQDSEERGAYYEASSTPTVVVDGAPVDPRFYGGYIQTAVSAYSVFRKMVEQRLTEKTSVSIQLSASVADGQLKLSAEATGVPEDLLPSCRLRMAIAENDVPTIGSLGTNGIRNHELLVREMPGGAKGIPPKKGELKYSVTMPFSELQQHLDDYIKRYEAGRRNDFPPEMKPPIQGPLSFIAWVQNDKAEAGKPAKAILQSALVPVTGEIKFSNATASESNGSDKPALGLPAQKPAP